MLYYRLMVLNFQFVQIFHKQSRGLYGIHLHGMLEHGGQYWGSGTQHELMTLEPFRALHHNPEVFTVFTCMGCLSMAASTGDLAASMN